MEGAGEEGEALEEGVDTEQPFSASPLYPSTEPVNNNKIRKISATPNLT